MKNIIITQRVITHASGEDHSALGLGWMSLSDAVGFKPVIYPFSINIDCSEFIRDNNVEGLIISGGGDLSIFDNSQSNIFRDRIELNLFKCCSDRSIPILGVCRGMQLLGNYLGASLKRLEDKSHVSTIHAIKPNPTSAYRDLLLEISPVNSFHNFVIETLPSNLNVSATSDDGYIEAFENKDNNMFCQMWHPERMEYNRAQIDLIRRIFKI